MQHLIDDDVEVSMSNEKYEDAFGISENDETRRTKMKRSSQL